jgi:hypothetical protein
MEAPEIHPPHVTHEPGHAGVPRWLNLTLAMAALITSLASILLGIENGRAMQHLVEAQSWPNLSFDNSNVIDGKPTIRLSIRSAGSGPVRVRSLLLRYKGKVVRNWPELMRECCASPNTSIEQLQRMVGNNLLTGSSHGALLPGDTALIFSVDRESADPTFWRTIDRERNRLTVETCYCSVFSDCYRLTSEDDEAKPVDECRPTDAEWNRTSA